MPERMGGQTLKEIVVYHGSTDIVKNPVCKLGLYIYGDLYIADEFIREKQTT